MSEKNFQAALSDLINRHSIENGSDTPDYILAKFLMWALNAFDAATKLRDTHYDVRTRECDSDIVEKEDGDE